MLKVIPLSKTKHELIKNEKNHCNVAFTKLCYKQIIINKLNGEILERILKFTNYQKQMKTPFVIYVNFENILKPFQHSEPI